MHRSRFDAIYQGLGGEGTSYTVQYSQLARATARTSTHQHHQHARPAFVLHAAGQSHVAGAVCPAMLKAPSSAPPWAMAVATTDSTALRWAGDAV